MKKIVSFSALKLKLLDGTLCIADLQRQQSSFTTHWDHLSLNDKVQEFHAVIGKDRKMVHVGDFTELSSPHYEEVCSVISMCNFIACYIIS